MSVTNVPTIQADALVEQKYLGCADCGGKVHSRGLCMTHYQAARRGGYLANYPVVQVYEAAWAQDMLMHILAIHGEDALEDALAVFRASNSS